MKIVKLLFVISLFGTLFCCRVSRDTEFSKTLDTMVGQKKFELRAKTAHPLNTTALGQVISNGILPPGSSPNRINLAGRTSYLKIYGDSVAARLPYYGERHMGGHYNTPSSIEFKGLAEQLEISKNSAEPGYSFRFKATAQTEVFMVNGSLLPNQKFFATVGSSQRSPIRYQGTIAKLSDNESDKSLFYEK